MLLLKMNLIFINNLEYEDTLENSSPFIHNDLRTR